MKVLADELGRLLMLARKPHQPRLSNTAHVCIDGRGKMAREPVWLENNTFAAWGCTGCAWIIPNPGPTVSGKPPATVKDAFDKHECAKFPRIPVQAPGKLPES